LVSDITYLRAWEGWIYLGAVEDPGLRGLKVSA
jgi:hypothetical protein